MEQKLPLPPFTFETATKKVQMAEDAWNSKDIERVALAYTIDTEWRNRDLFINGRDEVKAFLKAKWEKELDYKLKKTLWAFTENRIAVRFEYEDIAGQCENMEETPEEINTQLSSQINELGILVGVERYTDESDSG